MPLPDGSLFPSEDRGGFYRCYFARRDRGRINVEDGVHILLLADSYEPDLENHDLADLLLHEASGKGYAPGGEPLSITVLESGAWRAGRFVLDDCTVRARYAALYHRPSGTPILLDDPGRDKACAGGQYEVSWAGGVILDAPPLF